VPAKRVDPKVTKLLKSGEPGQRLTVTVKLARNASHYALLPVSNEPNSERARVFSGEVEQLVRKADRRGAARVVDWAAKEALQNSGPIRVA
jgi:hypothetical protein